MKTLIYTNSSEELRKIINCLEGEIIVASDSFDIIEMANSDSRIYQIGLFSEKKPFVKDAVDFARIINSTIHEKCGLKNNSFLYELPYLVEGHSSVKKISDLLYYIDYFNDVMRNNNISKVYSTEYSDVVKDALYISARHNKIPICKCISNSCVKKSLYEKIKKSMVYKYYIWMKENIFFISLVLGYRKKIILNDEKYDIGYVSNLASNKRKNNAIRFAKMFQNNKKICFLCYGNLCEKVKTDIEDIDVIPVEKYSKEINVLKCIGEFICDYKKINIDSLFIWNGIDLSNVVLDIYKEYVVKNGLKNIIYLKLSEVFFSHENIRLLTCEGDSCFPINRVLFEASVRKKENSSFFKIVPYITAVDINALDYTENYSNMFKYELGVKNSPYYRFLLNSGWSGKYYSLKLIIEKRNNIINSRINDNNVNVLWAPSYPTLGVYSVSDFLMDNDFIFRYFSNTQYKLKVKFHPNQDMRMIKNYCNQVCDNVEFLSKDKDIRTIMEDSAVVITTPSTVLMDCLCKQIPVVCIVNERNSDLVSHLEEAIIIIKAEKKSFDCIFDEKPLMEIADTMLEKQRLYVESINNDRKEKKYDSVEQVINELLMQ